ncbi:MAG TPA: pyridoxamine 5'-phosphate oxidase family protein [Chitinophagaceae bacterium]
MFGKLTNDEIEQVLRTRFVGRIGCHADGITYVVPISYAYDDGYVYAHTLDGMKLNIMRKNPAVCFEVDEMKDMANWKSVIAWGEFEELKGDSDRKTGMKKLVSRILPIISSETTHLTPHWPFPDDDPAGVKGILFRIFLKEKTGRFESNISATYLPE